MPDGRCQIGNRPPGICRRASGICHRASGICHYPSPPGGAPTLASWDVFHSDSLEVERALTTAEVREAMAQGRITEDDLVRPAGSTARWARLADTPEVLAEEPEPEPPPAEEPVQPGPALVLEEVGLPGRRRVRDAPR